MNISNNVKTYIEQINVKIEKVYREQNIPRFNNPEYTCSQVQERIMRLGIEQHITGACTEDELYLIALATLQEDYINNYTSNNDVTLNDFDILFNKQIMYNNLGIIKCLYFLSTHLTGQLEVYSATSIEWIKENFSIGKKGPGDIPYLYV